MVLSQHSPESLSNTHMSHLSKGYHLFCTTFVEACLAQTTCLHADGSEWRQRIEQEAEHFLDVSAWSVGDIAGKISSDEIQVAINLNGYTKGARNEIFALLPAPVQTSYMGFPATTGRSSCQVCITCQLACLGTGARSSHENCPLESSQVGVWK